MKKLTHRFGIALGATLLSGLAILAGTAGCAGDRYSRSTGEFIDDHSLQLRVDHALNENSDYKFEGVSLAAFKGVIQLNG
jgi:hypothetical protein